MTTLATMPRLRSSLHAITAVLALLLLSTSCGDGGDTHQETGAPGSQIGGLGVVLDVPDGWSSRNTADDGLQIALSGEDLRTQQAPNGPRLTVTSGNTTLPESAATVDALAEPAAGGTELIEEPQTVSIGGVEAVAVGLAELQGGTAVMRRYVIVNTDGTTVLQFLLEAPEEHWASSVDTLEQILASAEFVTRPSGEAEQSTTTRPPIATTTEIAGPTAERIAEAIVLDSGVLGAEWDEAPQGDTDLDYAGIDGCEFVHELVEADGHLIEAESPEFNQHGTYVEHDVRVYPDAETAIDVVLTWAQDPVTGCTREAASRQVQERIDSGELAPYTTVDVDIAAVNNLIGEPRAAGFEIVYTLDSPEGELAIYVEVYFLQHGRSVSSISVSNPGGFWASTGRLVDLILDRMAIADEFDTR